MLNPVISAAETSDVQSESPVGHVLQARAALSAAHALRTRAMRGDETRMRE